ncbi:preprotein translocase subunit SecY [Agathobacter sp.]
MIMLVYMIGRNIPLYGIDVDAYNNVSIDAQSILLQALSGDMKNCSIFILGLWPYMLASMLAVLIVAIMSIDSSRKISPKKINIWTMLFMMIIASVQAYQKVQTFIYDDMSADMLTFTKIIVFIQLIAGMLIVVYMCDRTAKYGIGGRMSVFMINIVDGMMKMFAGQKADRLILPVVIGVIEIAIMIVLETTEKRIAVQRVSIHNIYADKNYIAYKLNPVGAMPLMFTSAVFMLPQFICSGLYHLHPDNLKLAWLVENLRLTSVFGIIVYLAIIVILTILFSLIMLTPGKEAENLLKSGDSIQDIYAGKPTKRYLVGTVLRFSIYSSIIICICQGVPLFLQFGGHIDSSLAMLPCSIMMSTGIWISLYREGTVYRNMDKYHPFI